MYLYKNTKIIEANLSIFVYGLFREVFTSLISTTLIKWKLHETNTERLTSVIFVHKAHHWTLYHMWFQNKSELYI